MSSIPCDIVVLPSSELAQRAISLSRELQRYGALYVLEDGSCFPHASLYMTQLKIDDLAEAQRLLADIAISTQVLDLAAIQYHQAEGFIDAEYERISQIEQLQMRVIDAINPIRDGMREKDKARMNSTTGLVRKNLEKYGYRGVGEVFNPHLSITRFANGRKITTGDLPHYSELDGHFTKIGIFEMGDNGTCIRKIGEFELQPRLEQSTVESTNRLSL